MLNPVRRAVQIHMRASFLLKTHLNTVSILQFSNFLSARVIMGCVSIEILRPDYERLMAAQHALRLAEDESSESVAVVAAAASTYCEVVASTVFPAPLFTYDALKTALTIHAQQNHCRPQARWLHCHDG
jgi:hypothetical protein